MKYRATKKFDELGTECSYHGLKPEDYHLLKSGKTITDAPEKLIEGGYLMELKHGS